MRLIDALDENKLNQFKESNIKVPTFDIKKLREDTRKAPTWIHFGAGNIFRAFPAAVLNRMIEAGEYDRGVIVAEGFDEEILSKAYAPFDNLSLLTVLKADGSVDKEVIASVVEALNLSKEYKEDFEALKEYFKAPSLQMVSFTITEKGYKNMTLMSLIAELLYERFVSGQTPIALASMDNCSHNGDKLKDGVISASKELVAANNLSDEFITYLTDENKVSFPWSMIDKITPRPDEGVQKMLMDTGFEDADIIVTDKHTYTAAFVNAEETEYLVIEDKFPNGRPPFEKGGVLFTDKETVDKVEKMKVCTCLNPLHTAMAIYGCVLGYDSISKEMKDDDIRTLITRMGYEEGMKVVVNPGIIKPEDFINQVLTKRLPNPFMPDTPQRIACDTSQKIPVRFGETLSLYKERNLGVSKLKFIPLVIAGYLRYLLGVDDNGDTFEPSPDPELAALMDIMSKIKLGEGNDAIIDKALSKILHRKDIFKVDLYECGLDTTIRDYFIKMIKGKGAVREVLHDAVI